MDKKYDKNCIHCRLDSLALKYKLFEDENFWIVCDAHPLAEGHILIVTKEHLPCAGAISDRLFKRFEELYGEVQSFISSEYGQTAVFEHGVVGQTVFHCHVHFLPFGGSIKNIIKNEKDTSPLNSLRDLKSLYEKNGKYLFVSIGKKMWNVDTAIARPRFFRDIFATALGYSEKGDWKKSEENQALKKDFQRDIGRLRERWQNYKNKS